MAAPDVEPVRRLLADLTGSATAEEIADCLWLAAHLPNSGRPAGPRAYARADDTEPPAPPARPPHVRSRPVPANTEPAESPRPVEIATLPVPVAPAPSSALHGSLQILRALRPLKRRAPSPQRWELDEAATVALIVEQKLWVPVMRPVRDRWLDLAVVIDESPLAPLWRDTIDAFVDTCRYLGAFRTITVQHLRSVEGAAMLARTAEPSQRFRPPGALPAAGRRQLILLISDALGPNWPTGAANRVLAQWGEQAAVAIVDPLPERLWRHTWLEAIDGYLSAPHRGAANAQTRARTQRDGVGSGALSVPVLELDRQWLRPWAHYTAGTSGRWTDAAITFVGERRPVRTAGPELIPAPPDPVEQAFTLRTSLAPDTYRLAGLLAAAAPLTIPVMRHVQQQLLPQTGPAEIAELYLSTIFEPTAQVGPTTLYDLKPGLRPVLQSTLRYYEIADVVTTVSSYLAEHHSGPDAVGAAMQAEFARVSRPVLSRLGVRAPQLTPRPTDPAQVTHPRLRRTISIRITQNPPGHEFLILGPDRLTELSYRSATEPRAVADYVNQLLAAWSDFARGTTGSRDDAWYRLADMGYRLFRLLFDDEPLRKLGETLANVLWEQDHIITVTSDDVHIPWQLLYVPRPGSPSPSRDVPVDVRGFVGYRHLVENRPASGIESVSDISFTGRPSAAFVTSRSLRPGPDTADDELLNTMAYRARTTVISASDQFDEHFRGQAPQLLYLDTPATIGNLYLILSSPAALQGSPLVFLNADAPTNTAYRAFEFLRAGASCVIQAAPQTPVEAANRFATEFFNEVLSTRVSFAETLRRLTRRYIDRDGDPIGLGYVGYCTVDAHFCPTDVEPHWLQSRQPRAGADAQ
ncbi:hypothetical protein GCM10009827_117040 [Dactylosporangium maewongense]|uniref:Uncharacterized protein n=1 Tax=Dactylosporangium maewongense TaxID=634393 RepID=A0ABP4P8F1_9ACTN